MSVAAERSHSPSHFRQKRSFEPADSPEHHPYSSEHHIKRPRQHHRARASREGLPELHHASAARASTLLALKGLFPGMEEQVCSRSSFTQHRSWRNGAAVSCGVSNGGKYICSTVLSIVNDYPVHAHVFA